MESAIKLISALAQIMWPILGFTILLIFKKELSEILRRIKKGKMLGQEIELIDSLETLRVSAETVKETALILPPTTLPSQTLEAPEELENDEIKSILDEASRSPRVALIALGGYIERAAKEALASAGILQPLRRISATEAVDRLSHRYGGLPGDIVNSMKLFMDIRNKIVHTREATEDDVISAIDSGITILRILKALPSQTLSVLDYNIPIYSDPECKNLQHGSGLILESVGPGGFKRARHIFPTTLTDYKKGQKLTSEWDTRNVWDKTWYIDPEDGKKKTAWISSGEFRGRPIESIYTSLSSD